jgi:hypothetical protein
MDLTDLNFDDIEGYDVLPNDDELSDNEDYSKPSKTKRKPAGMGKSTKKQAKPAKASSDNPYQEDELSNQSFEGENNYREDNSFYGEERKDNYQAPRGKPVRAQPNEDELSDYGEDDE